MHMRVSRQFRSVAVATVVTLAGSAAAIAGGTTHGNNGNDGGGRDWVGSWSAAVTHGEPTGFTNTGLTNQSARYVVRPSVGGDKIRIRFSNLYGEKAVQIGAATVAKPNTSTPALSDVDTSTLRTLTFNGSPTTTMNKGAEVYTDPVDLKLADLGSLVISAYFPTGTGPTTWHASALQDNFYGAGNLTAAADGTGYTTTRPCCWLFLSGVDVYTSKSDGAVVALGDSITDGIGSTQNANNRWTDQLAERLIADRHGRDVPGVLNTGLAGSRLNHEGPEAGDAGFPGFEQLGVNALARVNEDVFSQTKPSAVITLLGVNDIWISRDPAAAVIASLRQINTQAHEKGITSLVGTITPFEGLAGEGAWTPEKEAVRQAVNSYLRSSHEWEAVIDFDKVMRDPAHPSQLNPAYDSGDHIHPNDAGHQAMANAVPLNKLR